MLDLHLKDIKQLHWPARARTPVRSTAGLWLANGSFKWPIKEKTHMQKLSALKSQTPAHTATPLQCKRSRCVFTLWYKVCVQGWSNKTLKYHFVHPIFDHVNITYAPFLWKFFLAVLNFSWKLRSTGAFMLGPLSTLSTLKSLALLLLSTHSWPRLKRYKSPCCHISPRTTWEVIGGTWLHKQTGINALLG